MNKIFTNYKRKKILGIRGTKAPVMDEARNYATNSFSKMLYFVEMFKSLCTFQFFTLLSRLYIAHSLENFLGLLYVVNYHGTLLKATRIC